MATLLKLLLNNAVFFLEKGRRVTVACNSLYLVKVRYDIYEAKGEELYMHACRPALTCHCALGLRGFVGPLRRDHTMKMCLPCLECKTY